MSLGTTITMTGQGTSELINMPEGTTVSIEAGRVELNKPEARKRPLSPGTFTKPTAVRYVEAPRGIPTPQEKRAYLNKRKKFLAHKKGK